MTFLTQAVAEPNVLLDSLTLAVAAAIGILITGVQRYTRREQPLSQSMEQASVLLCVAGALTMLIIGGSVARAFGVAGAASVIRFRTPVDDPRDITVLYLLIALGMAAGLSLFAVAGVGTLFLCACLLAMGRRASDVARAMKVALVAEGQQFPEAHVSRVFAEHRIAVTPLEVFHGDQAVMRYRAVLGSTSSIELISAALLNGGSAGLKSVSWEASKKGL